MWDLVGMEDRFRRISFGRRNYFLLWINGDVIFDEKSDQRSSFRMGIKGLI